MSSGDDCIAVVLIFFFLLIAFVYQSVGFYSPMWGSNATCESIGLFYSCCAGTNNMECKKRVDGHDLYGIHRFESQTPVIAEVLDATTFSVMCLAVLFTCCGCTLCMKKRDCGMVMCCCILSIVTGIFSVTGCIIVAIKFFTSELGLSSGFCLTAGVYVLIMTIIVVFPIYLYINRNHDDDMSTTGLLVKADSSSQAAASQSLETAPALPNLPGPDQPTPPVVSESSSSPMATSSLSSPSHVKPHTCIWDRARMGKLDSAKHHRITRKIAAYLVNDMRPLSTVESESFRNMIHAIDERVVVPNRQAFIERIIPAWYDLEATKLQKELNSTSHVALTSDCWTSRTTISYMTITSHFVNNNFELQSKVLQTKVLDERHTQENVSVALNSVLEEWKITDKVTFITTDNASNMTKAVEISDINTKIGCFAHTLDLAAKKAVELAKPISKKMKPVISFLHRSHIGAKVLKEMQEKVVVPRHQLITDIETRWNSTYLMVDRYIEQRIAIHATFLDKRLESNKDVYRDFKDSEVRMAEEFLHIMKPFYDMTQAVCSERNPTASLILFLLDKVLRKCEETKDESEFSRNLKQSIKDSLSKRYKDADVRECLLKAATLDPRLKLKPFLDEYAWNLLRDELASLIEKQMLKGEVKVEPEEDENRRPEQEVETRIEKKPRLSLLDSFIWEDEDVRVTAAYKRTPKMMAADEIRLYRELPTFKDPLQFWNTYKYKIPHLAKLASKYLIIQATSVASERVFSTSGDILAAERSCLDEDSLDAVIFLKKNAGPCPEF